MEGIVGVEDESVIALDTHCAICGKPIKRVQDRLPDGSAVGLCCDTRFSHRAQKGEHLSPATEFGPGNLMHLSAGMRTKPERLPAEYQVKLPADISTPQIVENLEAMLTGASALLERIAQCSDLDMVEYVGMYQQITTTLTDTLMEIEGGKLKAGNYGAMTAERARLREEGYARDVSNALTKFSYTYQWVQKNQYGLVTKEGHPRKSVIRGLAGTLAGACRKIRAWAALRQWEEKKRETGSNDYVNALRNARRG
jgi:hypothetical protein